MEGGSGSKCQPPERGRGNRSCGVRVPALALASVRALMLSMMCAVFAARRPESEALKTRASERIDKKNKKAKVRRGRRWCPRQFVSCKRCTKHVCRLFIIKLLASN